jgi:hypothetical protein
MQNADYKMQNAKHKTLNPALWHFGTLALWHFGKKCKMQNGQANSVL